MADTELVEITYFTVTFIGSDGKRYTLKDSCNQVAWFRSNDEAIVKASEDGLSQATVCQSWSMVPADHPFATETCSIHGRIRTGHQCIMKRGR